MEGHPQGLLQGFSLKMVQYIITPWRNRKELLGIRKAFYSSSETNKTYNDQERHEAVELVSVWVQRGNCPHSVESTALLVSAMLNEECGTSVYAIRAAYAAAFSRFVTGLLDGYQDKKHKLSMYSIAKNIGLPATFVELRHQCTHEELPSLANLRAAAERSLLWIWDYYWKNLEEITTPVQRDELHLVLSKYFQQMSGQLQEKDRWQDSLQRLRRWNDDEVLEVLMEICEATTTKPTIIRQALILSRAILSGKEIDLMAEPLTDIDPVAGKAIKSLKDIESDVVKATESLKEEGTVEESLIATLKDERDIDESDDDDEGTGWEMWRGPWTPKPIGVV